MLGQVLSLAFNICLSSKKCPKEDNPNPCSVSEGELWPIAPMYQPKDAEWPGQFLLQTELAEISTNVKFLLKLLRTLRAAEWGLTPALQSQWRRFALVRYRNFLLLKQRYPSALLVPTLDIEFVWICHILDTGAYVRDLYWYPEHDMYMHPVRSKLYDCFVMRTAELWEELVGAPLFDKAACPKPHQVYQLRTASENEASYYGPQRSPRVEPAPTYFAAALPTTLCPLAVGAPEVSVTGTTCCFFCCFPSPQNAFAEDDLSRNLDWLSKFEHQTEVFGECWLANKTSDAPIDRRLRQGSDSSIGTTRIVLRILSKNELHAHTIDFSSCADK
jgi:hypothetical protein